MRCNIGATSETDYGLQFQWGATEGHDYETDAKEHSSWNTCPWGMDTPPVTILDAAHDAVTAAYDSCCMPTKEQVEELIDNTTVEWIIDFNGSGVNGSKFTASNGNYIFIPASGIVMDGESQARGSIGFGWTSSLSTGYPVGAFNLFITDGVAAVSENYRSYSNTVRGVKIA